MSIIRDEVIRKMAKEIVYFRNVFDGIASKEEIIDIYNVSYKNHGDYNLLERFNYIYGALETGKYLSDVNFLYLDEDAYFEYTDRIFKKLESDYNCKDYRLIMEAFFKNYDNLDNKPYFEAMKSGFDEYFYVNYQPYIVTKLEKNLLDNNVDIDETIGSNNSFFYDLSDKYMGRKRFELADNLDITYEKIINKYLDDLRPHFIIREEYTDCQLRDAIRSNISAYVDELCSFEPEDLEAMMTIVALASLKCDQYSEFYLAGSSFKNKMNKEYDKFISKYPNLDIDGVREVYDTYVNANASLRSDDKIYLNVKRKEKTLIN